MAFATVVGAHERYFICKFCSFSFEKIGWTEKPLKKTILFTVGADFTTLSFGTLITGEGLADSALAGCDRELVAHSAYEEVELVGVCGADVEQLWL